MGGNMNNDNQKYTKIIFIIIGVAFILVGGYAYFAKKDFFYLALSILFGLLSISIGFVFSLQLEEKFPHQEESESNEDGL